MREKTTHTREGHGCHGCSGAQGGSRWLCGHLCCRGMGAMRKERHPWGHHAMGSRRVRSGGRKGHCVVKHVRHHITSLGFCLLPGGRTSPSSSKPHALRAPPNTVFAPVVQTPSPSHSPSPLPLVLGGWCPGRWERALKTTLNLEHLQLHNLSWLQHQGSLVLGLGILGC